MNDEREQEITANKVREGAVGLAMVEFMWRIVP